MPVERVVEIAEAAGKAILEVYNSEVCVQLFRVCSCPCFCHCALVLRRGVKWLFSCVCAVV